MGAQGAHLTGALPWLVRRAQGMPLLPSKLSRQSCRVNCLLIIVFDWFCEYISVGIVRVFDVTVVADGKIYAVVFRFA